MDYQVGATLAAALRDIYKIYFPFSQPLPADLVEALRGVVPDNTLAVARWAVAPAPELNIPGFLGSSHSAGRTRAVTVGDLMIFPRMPQLLDRADVEWLLHELRHVEQHRTLTRVILESVDASSVQYVRQSEALEQDAVEVAAERIRELR
jgi:hypothetical protein